MGFEKYYDKDLIDKSNMSLDEFNSKIKEGKSSFIYLDFFSFSSLKFK